MKKKLNLDVSRGALHDENNSSAQLLDALLDATSQELMHRAPIVDELLKAERQQDLLAEFESSYRMPRHSKVAELLDRADKKTALDIQSISRIFACTLRYGPAFDAGMLMSVVNVAGRHLKDHRDRALEVLEYIIDLPRVPKSTRSAAVVHIAPHADLKTVERMLCRALSEKEELAALSTMVTRVGTDSLEMSGLSSEGFEFLVKTALLCAARKDGRLDEQYRVTGGPHDGGVDVVGTSHSGPKDAPGTTIVLVQCKNVKQLKEEDVRQFAEGCLAWSRKHLKRTNSELPGTSVVSKPRKLLVSAVSAISERVSVEAKVQEIDLLFGSKFADLVEQAVGRKIILRE